MLWLRPLWICTAFSSRRSFISWNLKTTAEIFIGNQFTPKAIWCYPFGINDSHSRTQFPQLIEESSFWFRSDYRLYNFSFYGLFILCLLPPLLMWIYSIAFLIRFTRVLQAPFLSNLNDRRGELAKEVKKGFNWNSSGVILISRSLNGQTEMTSNCCSISIYLFIS